MNPFKKLAGQTAIYGVPSIVGRILNYLLVPLYTRTLDQAEYGVVILMYSFVAVFFIVLTYGMETSFFRYSELEKNKEKVYSTGLISLFVSTLAFLMAVLLFSGDIANWIKYPQHSEYVVWLGIILSLDVLSAIPFARLRMLNKARRFAMIKMINIGINIFFNLFFILFCPYILENHHEGFLFQVVQMFFDPQISLIAYIFISNLIASSITLLLLIPDIFSISFRFDKALWTRMIIYALPLLFAGLAGIMNETLGRIMLRYLLPENIAEAELGLYSASYKIAILMSLFIQAFRYAVEPFFFAYAGEKDARATYAQLMNYFSIAASLLFLAIMLYIDVVILILGKDFRSYVSVIPILLLAYMFMGLYYNLSVWFKVTNKTRYGAMMAIFGALITLLLNYLWIPRFGYLGSAWATFACYGSMLILSYFLMRKYYSVPYQVKKVVFYIALAVILFFVSQWIDFKSETAKYIVNTFLMLVYVFVAGAMEWKNLKQVARH
ncbi:MAG: polysaccharide biosynthesis C-terminal domain-containing protein [Bacteroidales bacterium]|nr:polysaccharide biosynthesis C-terminal domain-containing protein [Bacteroidales bacterium]MCF8386447.1 polysaccharide biosynthesis C-terminal domain-containing protein [Bacteroidales bacterium]MCF8397809.1 polysaccharide biosynthesis C-terminal domain-containing protein [Bacteroidales bacterium]